MPVGTAAGVQPCLLGAECAEHFIGDLARPRLMHLGDAIGDRGRCWRQQRSSSMSLSEVMSVPHNGFRHRFRAFADDREPASTQNGVSTPKRQHQQSSLIFLELTLHFIARCNGSSRCARDERPDVTADFAGQTALVTGGNTGIGRAVAGQPAACGAHVLISGRDPRSWACRAGGSGRMRRRSGLRGRTRPRVGPGGRPNPRRSPTSSASWPHAAQLRLRRQHRRRRRRHRLDQITVHRTALAP